MHDDDSFSHGPASPADEEFWDGLTVPAPRAETGTLSSALLGVDGPQARRARCALSGRGRGIPTPTDPAFSETWTPISPEAISAASAAYAYSNPEFADDWEAAAVNHAAASQTSGQAADHVAGENRAAACSTVSAGTLDPDYVASLHLLSRFPASEHEQVRAKMYRDADGMIRTRHRLMKLVQLHGPAASAHLPVQPRPGTVADLSDDVF